MDNVSGVLTTWIALSDFAVEGTFLIPDLGCQPKFTSFNMPSNNSLIKDCVVFMTVAIPTFKHVSCTGLSYFVCQIASFDREEGTVCVRSRARARACVCECVCVCM